MLASTMHCRSLASFLTRRSFSKSPELLFNGYSAKALVYDKFGPPNEVLKLKEIDLPEPGEGEVIVRPLLCSINPADISTLQNLYGRAPSRFPAVRVIRPQFMHSGADRESNVQVAGYEFVGDVVASPQGSLLKQGDRVIRGSFKEDDIPEGVWRTAFVAKELSLVRVPRELPLEVAAVLSINGLTAALLLREAESMTARAENLCIINEGEESKAGMAPLFVQNAANSSVGQLLIQLAHGRGHQSINMVRPRKTEADSQALVDQLKNLGGSSVVVTSNDKEAVKKALKECGCEERPYVGFNAVGGSAVAALTPFVRDNGDVWTYGGMSGKPMLVPTGDHIFRGLTFKSFWLANRIADCPVSKIERLVDEIVSTHERRLSNGLGGLFVSAQIFPLSEYQNAISTALNRQPSTLPPKVMLSMQD